MKSISSNFIFLLLFVISMRLIPHPPNFTPVLATAILAPHIFSKKIVISIFLLILAMFISDIFIGLHKFLFFTYLPLIFILLISNYTSFKKKNIFILAIVSPLIFFIISNFGVWLLSDFYEKDIIGLYQCYIMAIPFLQNSFISTVVFLFLYFIFYNSSIYVISQYYPRIVKFKTI